MPANGHALLSASSAHRWLACPPSARLEEQFPDSAGEAAMEGTLAHLIVEHKLLTYLRDGKPGKTPARLRNDPLYKPVMEDYTDEYISYVCERQAEAEETCEDAQLFSEQRVDFSRWVPAGFGTADTIIIADGTMWVIDFKYGKHVLVEAAENPQLKLYALGALEKYSLLYDITRVMIAIVQPRMDGVTEAEYTPDALYEWADTVVTPTAKLADAGEGDYCPGEHCIFCRAQPVCRAYKEKQMELARFDFADPPTLTQDEIAEILVAADSFKRWLTKISDYALEHALGGDIYPGFKLVSGRANRKITDEAQAAAKLRAAGFDAKDYLELKGLTALEDMAGKKRLGEILGELIVKPEGRPTLVPESDKRPALNSTASAKQDFDD